MGLGIWTEVRMYAEIREVFKESVYCEHGSHRWDTDKHWGPAKWYLQLACPNCGWATGLLAVCDPWKRYVEGGGKVYCLQRCDKGASGVDWIQMVQPMRKE